MNAFLWTVAIFGALNTAVVMCCFFLFGKLPPVTPASRLIDALGTFTAMVWAIALLAQKGV